MSAVSFPMGRGCPFAPPEAYQRYLAEERAQRLELASGQRVWALARHADVRAMLNDPRFSADRERPGYPDLFGVGPQPPSRLKPSLFSMDPPVHTAARREVLGEFTVRRVHELRPRIQEIVDDHVTAIVDGPRPADLVESLALPVPSLVICELLGIPYDDHEFFQQRSSTLVSRGPTPEERLAAINELHDYLDGLVRAAEKTPGDDLLGRQVGTRRTNGTYDRDDLVSLAFLLLIAGHETTANATSLGIVALLENPGQLAALRADPSLTPGAVDEVLRYFSVGDLVTTRVATEDVTLAGVTIRAGEGVIGLGQAANFDPLVFPDPGRLDITRATRGHVAFGFGPHQCLGANLARLEMTIVFDTLFARLPDLRLAVPFAELPFKHESTVFGLHALPVTWV